MTIERIVNIFNLKALVKTDFSNSQLSFSDLSETAKDLPYQEIVNGQIIFGEFQVIRRISDGPVFLVTNIAESNSLYAIKISDRELIFTSKINLRNEYIQHSMLESKNIVKIHSPLEDQEYFGILMEYVGGGDLADYLKRKKFASVDNALKIFKSISLALKEVHSKNLVHADVKPENILLTSNGDFKLADFGLSRDLRFEITNDQETNGTLRYLCPDYVTTGHVHKTGDIFSLGIVIYELLTGDIPFSDKDIMVTLQKRVFENSPSLKRQVEGIPETFSNIVSKCLEIDLQKRYKDAKELCADLDSLVLKVQKRERSFSTRIRLFKEFPNHRRRRSTIVTQAA